MLFLVHIVGPFCQNSLVPQQKRNSLAFIRPACGNDQSPTKEGDVARIKSAR